MTYPVTVVDYDDRWPALFEEEKTRILDVIGDWVKAVEHIGSTAVPGLGAKPTIDIMVGVRALADAVHCIPRLREMGYEYVPEYEALIPERRYFRKGPKGARTHHLHMVEITSDFWDRHLLFRDYLRSHHEVAQEYFRLKTELARKFATDGTAYTDAKTSFIESVVAKARAKKGDDSVTSSLL